VQKGAAKGRELHTRPAPPIAKEKEAVMAALSSADETEIRSLYRQIVENWNNEDAQRFGALFVDDGESVGFDGSQLSGPELISEEMRRLFSDHATGRYVAKIQGIRALGGDAALLRALAGMVPAGASDLEPKLNVVHTLITQRSDGRWRVVLFQNTPAQWHGRPEKVEEHTEELRRELSEG
jgi:uncharacterized protein (TIGR02246 family)